MRNSFSSGSRNRYGSSKGQLKMLQLGVVSRGMNLALRHLVTAVGGSFSSNGC